MNSRQLLLVGFVFLLALEITSGQWQREGRNRGRNRGRTRPRIRIRPRPQGGDRCEPVVRWSSCVDQQTVVTETARRGRNQQCPALADPQQVPCLSSVQLLTSDCSYMVQYDFVPCTRRQNRYRIEVTSDDCPANQVRFRPRCTRGIVSDVDIVTRAREAGKDPENQRRFSQQRQRGRNRNPDEHFSQQQEEQEDDDTLDLDIDALLGLQSLDDNEPLDFSLGGWQGATAPEYSSPEQKGGRRRRHKGRKPEVPEVQESFDDFLLFINDMEQMWEEEKRGGNPI